VALHDVGKSGTPVIDGSYAESVAHGGGGVRASADGKTFVTFEKMDWQSRSVLLTEIGGKWRVRKGSFTGWFPNDRGDLIYGAGGAADASGNSTNLPGGGNDRWFIPATSGNYFLKLAAGSGLPAGGGPRVFTLTVHTNRKGDLPIPKVEAIPNIPTEGLLDRLDVALDQHFILVPEAKVLVMIPNTKDRVQFRRVELR
jgi:hypothetical protein